MRKFFISLFILSLLASCSYAQPVKHGQCCTSSELTELSKENVAGGKGVLYGEFAFIRDNARDEDAIKEIGFMTLKPGAYIGTHSHSDNEGNEFIVGPQSVTIATAGEAHSLANTGKENLVFIDLIAQNHALKKGE